MVSLSIFPLNAIYGLATLRIKVVTVTSFTM